MAEKTQPEIHIPLDAPLDELRHTDEQAVAAEIKALVREAEDTRVRFMRQKQVRGFVVTTISLVSGLAGAIGFGWYFLVDGDLAKAVICVLVSLLPMVLLDGWANAPIRKYLRAHKQHFMPKMAKVLGGFRYSADGGISQKVLKGCGIVPAFDRYAHEDCFLGTYKGIKVMFAEARLFRSGAPVFRGLFVLLEFGRPVFDGALIITANKALAQHHPWKNLRPTAVTASNPDWNRFLVLAEKPESAQKIVTESLLKELSEAADIFNRAQVSASFMNGKYITIAIPNDDDMFEASDLRIPIPTAAHGQQRRREIEKLLEVIDVFDACIG